MTITRYKVTYENGSAECPDEETANAYALIVNGTVEPVEHEVPDGQG